MKFNDLINLKRTTLFTALMFEYSCDAHAFEVLVDENLCNLGDAITAVNNSEATNGCVPINQGNTARAVIQLPNNAGILLKTALQNIANNFSQVTINGNGSILKRGQDADNFPILQIEQNDYSSTVTINDITLSNGKSLNGSLDDAGGIDVEYTNLKLNNVNIFNSLGNGLVARYYANVTIQDSVIDSNSGGIVLSDGDHLIEGSTISGNTTNGIVANYTDYSKLINVTVRNSVIDNNSVGIRLRGGNHLIEGTTISNNTTTIGTGGVEFVDDFYGASSLTIKNSVIDNNSGGISLRGGNHLIGGTTISNNTSVGGTGGIFFSDIPDKFSYGGRLIIRNSTISNNSGSNGGISQRANRIDTYYDPPVSYISTALTQVTVVNNTSTASGGGIRNDSGILSLSQSLVSGNTAASCGSEICSSGSAARTTTDKYNIFGVNGDAGVAGVTVGASDIVPAGQLADIIDTDLADNGGPTHTHKLVVGSPAIDAIPIAACTLLTDQTGKERPLDGNDDLMTACDIGAFEKGVSDIIFKSDFDL